MRIGAYAAAMAAAFVAVPVGLAHAQVVLSQKSFEAGVNFAAFFEVPHGCDGSPTLSLRVEIPEGVTVLELPQKEGWITNAERSGGRIGAISWRGRLEGGEAAQFAALMKLPARTGPLYFPTVQRCAKGEMRWTQIPAAGETTKLSRPAPSVELTNPAPRPATFMAGDIMVMQPWSRATPPGASTGAGYLTVMNHGTLPDVLLGGSTPAAAKLEIHQTSMAGGIMTMRPAADGVPIPPGASVTFKPTGGFHLMLSGLTAPLKLGTRIPATLNFSRAGKLEIELTVEAIGALAPAANQDGH
jgi:periplasmic copper chaperone A